MPAASFVSPAGSAGSETLRPGTTATRPPGALSPGRPPPPPRLPRPPPPPAPSAGNPASSPCNMACRCHAGCEASAITSITCCTAATSPLLATAAVSIDTDSVGDAAAAVFACITAVSTSLSSPFKLLMVASTMIGSLPSRVRSMRRRTDAVRRRHLADGRGHLPPHVPVLVFQQLDHRAL